MTTLLATGAYGRTASKPDWLKGFDFRVRLLAGGPYFSIRDTKAMRENGFNEILFCDIATGEILFKVTL